MYSHNWLDLSNKCLKGNPSSNHRHQTEQRACKLRREESDGKVPGEYADKAGLLPNLNANCRRETRIGSYPPENLLQPKQPSKSETETTKGGSADYHRVPSLYATNKKTSGFNKKDQSALSGPLHQVLKDCLSTPGPPQALNEPSIPAGYIDQENEIATTS